MKERNYIFIKLNQKVLY